MAQKTYGAGAGGKYNRAPSISGRKHSAAADMAAGGKHSAVADMAATLKGGGAASTAHPTVGEKHHLPDTPPAGSKPRFPHGAVSAAHLTVEEEHPPPLD